MSEFAKETSITELRAAHAEHAHRPGGLLHDIARSAEANGVELLPKDVADIILPPKQPDQKYQARWELLEGAPGLIKETAAARQEETYSLAQTLDLRKDQSIDGSDIRRIDADKAVWMIEGGANRTSVVRRQLAIEAMHEIYGEQVAEQVVYQFGADRPIPKERNGSPNAEYAIAMEIALDYLPTGRELTEFDLNLASAQQAGYEKLEGFNGNPDPDIIERLEILGKEDSPRLVMIQPKKVKGGLVDGINAVHEMILREATGTFVAEPHFQPVIFTNGQYRAKDEHQAVGWAAGAGHDILPPVAIGDEPGYTVEHNGRQIVTAERAPMVYVNEMVILHRLNS